MSERTNEEKLLAHILEERVGLIQVHSNLIRDCPVHLVGSLRPKTPGFEQRLFDAMVTAVSKSDQEGLQRLMPVFRNYQRRVSILYSSKINERGEVSR